MTRAEPGRSSMGGSNHAGDQTRLPLWAKGGRSWVWVGLSGATVAAVVFAVWELLQQQYFQQLHARTLHYLYITRGIALALFLLAWAACLVLAYRRAAFDQLCRMEKMSSMGQLAAGVAHQLNTPLASALLRAQMLEEDVQEPEQVEDLRFIQRQLRYGKEIVEGLLRFSRPSGEAKRAEPLNPILQGVVAMLEPTAQGTDIRLKLDLEATAGVLVYGGRNELEQVFFNLGSNALDAMSQGGVLTLITAVVQGRLAEVQVRDTGTGIPKDRLARIFEPFYTTKEPGKGTGLGLAICWRILEETGGSIDVASEVGRGTTFHVRLPIRQE